jgi:hypothetical protein
MPAKTKSKKTDETPGLTTREVADKLGADPRVLRRFLRTTEQGVGAGSRYEFKPDTIADLKKRFNAWKKATEEKAAEPKQDA